MDNQNLQNIPSNDQTLAQVNALGARFDKLEADIRGDAKELKEESKEQKNYVTLGFFVIGLMVIGLVASWVSEKVTADYELTHAIDLLQVQLQTQNNAKPVTTSSVSPASNIFRN